MSLLSHTLLVYLWLGITVCLLHDQGRVDVDVVDVNEQFWKEKVFNLNFLLDKKTNLSFESAHLREFFQYFCHESKYSKFPIEHVLWKIPLDRGVIGHLLLYVFSWKIPSKLHPTILKVNLLSVNIFVIIWMLRVPIVVTYLPTYNF